MAISCAQDGADPVASVQVSVFNGASMTDVSLRGLNVNRAIQDGLRWLYSQDNRAANFDGNTTKWSHKGGWASIGEFPSSETSLAVLAFENHGYNVPNNDDPATGLYERFIVQRGLNFIASQLVPVTLSVQPSGNPCQGTGSDCQGFINPDNGASDTGYSTALAALPLAGSGALARTFSDLPLGNNGGYPNGRTYGEMLQRLTNTIVWGQNDGDTCDGRGGWVYTFSDNTCQRSDGSTVGWDVLALLDSAAAGLTVPAFAKTEFATAHNNHTGTDGSYAYSADPCYPEGLFCFDPSVARSGVGLEASFWLGLGPGNFDDAIAANWNGASSCGVHLGCAYDMFNAFKGLKLHGIATLPGIGVPAGPGYPADDWYAAYVNWLLDNQTAPTTTTGGQWAGMSFSCCFPNNEKYMEAAAALLILSPVALIQPDPTLFATIGLAPTNAVNRPNTSHTVTATALSSGRRARCLASRSTSR